MPFLTQSADDEDPLFQLSLMGMVARELGMVAMMWEFQDRRLYFSGDALALGPLTPCMTPEAFRATVHPDDVAAFDRAMLSCRSGEGQGSELALRVAGCDAAWRSMDCRFRLGERDDAGQPVRLVGMLMEASAENMTAH